LARIYLTESRAHFERVLGLIHRSGKIRGLTVFKGAAGFGTTVATGETPDPPVVLEFFDTKDAIESAVDYIETLVAPHHVVTWPVEVRKKKAPRPR
jgi:uncharacterized protein